MMAWFPQLLVVTDFIKIIVKNITLNTKCEYQIGIDHREDMLVVSSQIGGHREDKGLFVQASET